jgi:hypothetical protein
MLVFSIMLFFNLAQHILETSIRVLYVEKKNLNIFSNVGLENVLW